MIELCSAPIAEQPELEPGKAPYRGLSAGQIAGLSTPESENKKCQMWKLLPDRLVWAIAT